jgi:hypothetical protein
VIVRATDEEDADARLEALEAVAKAGRNQQQAVQKELQRAKVGGGLRLRTPHTSLRTAVCVAGSKAAAP